MPYHPMKKHMEKLDDWGASAAKRVTGAGQGSSIQDRINLARGKPDDRWDRTKHSSPTTSNSTEDSGNIVPNRSARVGHLPPAPASATGIGSKRPPPPPQRNISNASSSSGPSNVRGPPPALPRRMDNESGIDRPPPPYVPASKPPAPPSRKPSQPSHTSSTSISASSEKPGYIEFSKFQQQDKDAFFGLLDEYFASKLSRTSSFSGKFPTQRLDYLATKATDSLPPAKITNINIDVHDTSHETSAGPLKQHPYLSASHHEYSSPCTALECVEFFLHRSTSEWSQAWYAQPNPHPKCVQGRNDVSWSSSMMGLGSQRTLQGSALFSDLSCLWWHITWKSNNPTATVEVQIAYCERPSSWDDEERLVEASKGFGEWIAGFAEDAVQRRAPVGDGECWTLAAEAIKYTNTTAQLTENNRLLTSIGRTHGHLIYAARVDQDQEQHGRWRGGDRVRAHGGGIRRGDIIEWRTAKCSEVGAPKGSYVTLGAPDHTGIVVDNAIVPDRLSKINREARENSLYSLLGVKSTSTSAEIRNAYLLAARKHHPDRGGEDKAYMQQLNHAHATLTNPQTRHLYDEELQNQRSTLSGRPNDSRVSDTVDLDAMEVIEDAEKLTFYHACRCGGGFYVNEDELVNSQVVISCSGCSERLRIVADQEAQEPTITDDPDQPKLAPWELGSISVIEQSAGQVPTRRTYDLSRESFTQGELWIYRPVWESELLGGSVKPLWPPSIPGWKQI